MNDELREAAQEFVDRVERGEIRSRYTYEKFKRILSARQGAADRSAEARLAWLHSPASNNVDGWEWGIFKVRWGRREGDHQIRHTFADFSDLDAAMGTPAAAEPGKEQP